jgi:tetratricopeptide (TPR) repeat protein
MHTCVAFIIFFMGFVFVCNSAFRASLGGHFSRGVRLGMVEQISPPTSKIFRYGTDLAIAEENLVLGNWEEAERMAKEAMRIAETMEAETNTTKYKNVFSAFANGILADALYHEGKFQESADAYRISLHQYEGAWQSTNTKTPETVEMVGATQLIASSLLDNEEDFDAALRTCQLALGLTEKLLAPDSREVAFALINLARAYMLAGDQTEAVEALLNRGINLIRYPQPWTMDAQLDPITREINYEAELMSNNYLHKAMSLLGDLHTIRGNLDEAIRVYSDAADMVTTFWEEEGVTEPESKDMVDILEKLSVLLFSKDDLKRAEDLSRRALWSLELRMGSPSQGAPDDTSELLQQTQDLKSLIANIHDTRRKEGEKAVRDDNASF